jgi:hypothetical protein
MLKYKPLVLTAVFLSALIIIPMVSSGQEDDADFLSLGMEDLALPAAEPVKEAVQPAEQVA